MFTIVLGNGNYSSLLKSQGRLDCKYNIEREKRYRDGKGNIPRERNAILLKVKVKTKENSLLYFISHNKLLIPFLI